MSRRERHVRELAEQLGVELELHKNDDEINGWAETTFLSRARRAWVWGWQDHDDERAYFAALHELGHHACGHFDTRADFMDYKARIVEEEAEAWEWAFGRALEPPGWRVLSALQTRWLGAYVQKFGKHTAGTAYSGLVTRFGLTI